VIVDLLLEAGVPASPSAVGAAGGDGHTAILRKLLARGDDPHGDDPDFPTIGRAANGGHYDAVVLLIEAGADPGAAGVLGVPLHGACSSGRLDLVQLLLDKRPDLANARVGLHTPLHDAVAGGNPEVIAYMLEHGADPDGTDEFGGTVRDYAS
jgi:ankyrin repeat protein